VDEQLYNLPFPFAGIDSSAGLMRQPTRPREGGGRPRATTPSGQNVRAFDPLTGRERGGSRPGLTKWISAAVVADWIIQELNAVGVRDDTVPNLSGRAIQMIAVSQGNVYVAQSGDLTWGSPSNLTGNTPPLIYTGVLFSAENNQKLYFADGTNWVYLDPKLNTVNTWTATAGTLPVDSENNTPRLICTWRGRTVLAGLKNDRQNWFMSRINDPHDWDYFPNESSAAQAVAGNNAPQGLIGDMITTLIPYSDDILLIGGDHTIWMLRGDPAAGGQIDRVSDSIGMAWGIPWCKDPYGVVYFFSNRCGIYSLVPGEAPRRVSQGIEQLVQEIDTGTNSIRMIWDDRWQGLHVFVTRLDQPRATTHYFWEQRTGAWWTDVFANNNHNPLCCAVFDGDDPNDRAALIGSWDGYVRKLDADADDDDGTAISSAVVLGPVLTLNLDDMLLKDLQTVLAEDSGNVTYAVHVGAHPEAALAATAAATGTWSEGRNLLSHVRRAGYAVYVKITATGQWAMESIRMRFAGRNKVRQRGR